MLVVIKEWNCDIVSYGVKCWGKTQYYCFLHCALVFAYNTMQHGLEKTCLMHILNVSNKACIDFLGLFRYIVMSKNSFPSCTLMSVNWWFSNKYCLAESTSGRRAWRRLWIWLSKIGPQTQWSHEINGAACFASFFPIPDLVWGGNATYSNHGGATWVVLILQKWLCGINKG